MHPFAQWIRGFPARLIEGLAVDATKKALAFGTGSVASTASVAGFALSPEQWILWAPFGAAGAALLGFGLVTAVAGSIWRHQQQKPLTVRVQYERGRNLQADRLSCHERLDITNEGVDLTMETRADGSFLLTIVSSRDDATMPRAIPAPPQQPSGGARRRALPSRR